MMVFEKQNEQCLRLNWHPSLVRDSECWLEPRAEESRRRGVMCRKDACLHLRRAQPKRGTALSGQTSRSWGDASRMALNDCALCGDRAGRNATSLPDSFLFEKKLWSQARSSSVERFGDQRSKNRQSETRNPRILGSSSILSTSSLAASLNSVHADEVCSRLQWRASQWSDFILNGCRQRTVVRAIDFNAIMP